MSFIDTEERECLQSIRIVKEEEIADESATFVVAELEYGDKIDNIFTVPFIIFDDGIAFMPYDWQGYVPTEVEDIESIDWITSIGYRTGFILNGLPRVFF